MKKVVVVTGPTASGKTGFGVELAKATGAEVVSADSMQVYKHLDIGTAKPTRDEMAGVRHHLIDFLEPDEPYNAGRFVRDATRAVEEINGRGNPAIIVGGTALYIKALLHGLVDVGGRDEGIRTELNDLWESPERRALLEELERVDPGTFGKVHPNDKTRIVRALEIWRSGGKRQSDLIAAHRFEKKSFDALRIGIQVERPLLYERIRGRVEAMMDAGWVAEVEKVLSLGYDHSIPPLKAIGYRQIMGYLRDEAGLAETVEEIKRETCRFAKRQMTWFRKMELDWRAPGEAKSVVAQVNDFLEG